MNRLHAACAVSLAALAMGIADQARAQAASPHAEASIELEDVVVTARRREERNQDVPISIVAIGGEQLRDRGVTNITDITNVAAGFKAEVQNGRPSTLQLTIRGQRMYGIVAAQDSPTAFYFADSLVLPISGFNTSLHDIASIQVLKGPQGTLFGRNTTGGALVVIPARPETAFGAAVTGTYGNYGTNGAKGFVNLPINDRLQIRLAAYYQEHDGYQHIVTPGYQHIEAGDDEAKDFRLSVLWKPTESIENYFIGYITRDRNGANLPRPVAMNPNGTVQARYGAAFAAQIWRPGDDFTAAYAKYRPYENLKGQGFINTTTADLGSSLTLKNIFAYRHVVDDAFFDTSGADNIVILAANHNDTYVYSEELQLQGVSFDSRLNWVVGGYFMRQGSNDFSANTAFNPTFLPNMIAPTIYRVNNKALAGYAQGTFKFTDRLSLTAGGRYTRDSRDIFWYSRFWIAQGYRRLGVPDFAVCQLRNDAGVALQLTPVDTCQIPAKKNFSEPTWTLTLDYKPTPGVLVYASHRRGYRTGGWNGRAAQVNQRAPYDAETVMDYEVGGKSDFHLGDWRMRVNAAAYYDRYKNLQRAISLFLPPPFNASTSVFNAGAGNAHGFEAEVMAKPLAELTLGANYAYTDFKYTRFPFFANGQTRDFSDRKLAGVPKHQLTAYVQYDVALPEGAGDLTMSANFNYVSSSFISEVYQSKQQLSVIYNNPAQIAALPDGDRPYKQRPYKLVNLRGEWKNMFGRPVDLAVYGRNVFNVAAETFNNPSYEGVGYAAVGFGPPRTYGVELTYRWDAGR